MTDTKALIVLTDKPTVICRCGAEVNLHESEIAESCWEGACTECGELGYSIFEGIQYDEEE